MELPFPGPRYILSYPYAIIDLIKLWPDAGMGIGIGWAEGIPLIEKKTTFECSNSFNRKLQNFKDQFGNPDANVSVLFGFVGSFSLKLFEIGFSKMEMASFCFMGH